MDCNIETSLNGTELTVKILGEIDHHSAKMLRERIDEALYYHRSKSVALDLSQVSFMDSSGLGLILGRFTLARELGGVLRVLNPNESVSRVLELAGTGRLIKIETDEKKGDKK